MRDLPVGRVRPSEKLHCNDPWSMLSVRLRLSIVSPGVKQVEANHVNPDIEALNGSD
jgi:hypothetical protein